MARTNERTNEQTNERTNLSLLFFSSDTLMDFDTCGTSTAVGFHMVFICFHMASLNQMTSVELITTLDHRVRWLVTTAGQGDGYFRSLSTREGTFWCSVWDCKANKGRPKVGRIFRKRLRRFNIYKFISEIVKVPKILFTVLKLRSASRQLEDPVLYNVQCKI